jgi:hypothetical protein
VVAYIDDRYDGSGFDAMLKCVGNNTPDIEKRKRDYYAEFKASGEFDYTAPVSLNRLPSLSRSLRAGDNLRCRELGREPVLMSYLSRLFSALTTQPLTSSPTAVR